MKYEVKVDKDEIHVEADSVLCTDSGLLVFTVDQKIVSMFASGCWKYYRMLDPSK